MSKLKLTSLILLVACVSATAFAQLAGTNRSTDNIWMSGDRKISFGPGPNATLQYSGGNLVIDVTQGGGKVSLPDGIDLGAGTLSFGASAIFEGTTADAFETTLTVVDPTADRTISLPNVSGTTLLSTAAQDAAASIKGVANGIEFEGATADAFESTISFTDPTADRAVVFADAAGTVMLSSLAANGVDVANAVTGASNALVFEGTADGFETSLSVTDPTADQTWTIPDFAVSAAFIGSTLTSNSIDAANSVWGISNALIFEGATADGFEATVTVADPGADATATIPNQTGTFLLSTAAQDAANSVKGVANGFEFEGSAADTNELTVVGANAGADVTVTIPAVTGTVCVGGALVVTAGANTACDTTCGAGKCCGAQDTDAAGILVGCAAAAADVCSCMP